MHKWNGRYPFLVGLLVLGVAFIGGGVIGIAPQSPGVLAHDDDIQTPEQAHQADLRLTAEAHGWTIQEAQVRFDATEAVNRASGKVYKRFPDVWVGSEVADNPLDPPILYIKGRASDAVIDIVRAEDVAIVIADGQPHNYAELEARKARVHDSLMKAGYDEVATRINITGHGVIPAGIRRTEGLPNDRESVLAVIPSDLRSDVRLTIHEESLFREEHAFGGMKTDYTGDNNFCTSGWTVYELDGGGGGTTGILGAAHCTPENRVHDTHTMTQQDRRYGAYGDVVWWTTGQSEQPKFYAESDEIRFVLGQAYDPSYVSLNQTLCMWGRKSLVRNCSAKVADKSISCGVLTQMVLMNKDVGNPGDSGGPWLYDNTAYGSHHGKCSDTYWQDAFTPTWNFGDALGVNVWVYE